MASDLNKRQQVFVLEYLKHGNATKAAIAAGYSKHSAPSAGSRMLKNRKIADELAQKHAKRCGKLEISAEKVLEGLGNLAFFDIRKLYNDKGELKPVTELDDQTAQAICGIEIEEVFERFGGGQAKPNGNLLKKIKLADRGINLERLGRYFKMFTDKLEVTGLEGLADALAKARKRRTGK